MLLLEQRRQQTQLLATNAILDVHILSRRNRVGKRSARRRRHWVNPGRTSQWWDNLPMGETTDGDWKKNLRMTKSDFFFLVDQLKPELEPDPNAVRDFLTSEKKVAMTLYYLKDQGSYSMTCNAFGIGKSTLSSVVKVVFKAINMRVGPTYLRLPQNENEMSDLIRRFRKKIRFSASFWMYRWYTYAN